MRVVLLPLVLLAACNRYDDFVRAGYVQDSFTNKADLLFVVDNSPSMTDEADALAVNFESFIGEFAEAAPPTERPTLADEVGRYLEGITNRGGSVNFQIGITTTESWADIGALLGRNPVLSKVDQNVPRKFVENLMCEAACVADDISVDVECPGGGSPGISTCADDNFGASEEGIEPVFAALCRASAAPPEACFAEWWWDEELGRWVPDPPTPEALPEPYFTQAQVGTNASWLREGSVVIPVIITDEGDQSRRIPGRDPKPDPYPELFRAFGHRMSWAVIGSTDECPGLSVGWGRDRYRNLVEATNGVYLPISVTDAGGNCVPADFGDALKAVGGLLRGLSDTFPLRSPPVLGTIVVAIDGRNIPEAESRYDEDLDRLVYEDGWYYDAVDNSVRLVGDAVPDFDADVSVWYLPTAPPRDLPF